MSFAAFAAQAQATRKRLHNSDPDPIIQLVTKAHRRLALKAEGIPLDTPWLKMLAVLYRAGAKTKKARARIVRITRIVFDDKEKRAEFDAITRLSSSASAALAWIMQITDPPPPPLTPEQREERRLAGIRRKAEKDERHARKMLAKHEAALKREKAAVKRWRTKVRYYDRKAGANEAT